MATSQNGGLVLQYGDSRLITTVIPGTNGAKFVGGVNGVDLNCVFMYIGSRWNAEIEPINAGWNWGHNVRSIRGQETGYSNHSAGEAIDINAPKHALGSQTLSAGQLAKLRSIASDLIGVIRFGAFYSGRKDEMHAERVGTYQQVSDLADRIRKGQLPNVPDELRTSKPSAPAPTPSPSPAPVGGGDWPLPGGHFFGPDRGGLSHDGSAGGWEQRYVAEFQHQLADLGYGVGVDGAFGPKTGAATREWQARNGLIQSGLVGHGDYDAIHGAARNPAHYEPASAPAPSAPAYPGSVLAKGSKGDAVRTMQARLNEHMRVLGAPQITVDGDFGSGTDRAVRSYQNARKGAPYNLTVDGKVGPATWSSLWN